MNTKIGTTWRPALRAMRAAILVGMVCSGCSGDPETPAAPAKPPATTLAAVVMVPAAAGQLVVSQRFQGRVEAFLSAPIAPGVAGTVLAVAGREGDAVKQGDLLVSLDEGLIGPRIEAAQAEARRLEAELRQARSERNRAAALSAPIVTEAERERFETRVGVVDAQLKAARANIRTLEAERERHRIAAPFDGVIQSRFVDPGAWVNAGQVVLQLMGAGAPEVFVDIPAELGVGMLVGQRLKVLSDPPGEAEVAGAVRALDPVTRTMQLRLKPLAENAWLIPGRQVEVEVTVTRTGDGAVVLPRDALKRGPASTRVYLVADKPGPDGGFATTIAVVEVLGANENDALVRGDGLVVGTKVVTRGNERLRPGQAVMPLVDDSSKTKDVGGSR